MPTRKFSMPPIHQTTRGQRLAQGRRRPARAGFTLIEILTVIAIIGILIGLLVPTVMAVNNSIRRSAMAFEVQTLRDAMTQYKNKYGDFPPDGSNVALLTQHLQKAFPQIAPSEIALLTSNTLPGTSTLIVNSVNGGANDAAVMDPSEAIVFFLGGLSEDPVYPFSGIGGPIFITNTSGVQVTSVVPPAGRGSVQYNVDRNNPLFDFKQDQLTLQVLPAGFTVSSEEADLFAGGVNDILPSYTPSGALAPYVYFNASSYSFLTTAPGSSTPFRFFNQYNPSGITGIARPYKSGEVLTTVAVALNADLHFRYQAPDTFQIIGAGLDDEYGGIEGLPNGGVTTGQNRFSASPMFYAFPSGQSLDISTGNRNLTAYSENNGPSPQLDNVTSFSEGTLENALP